MLGRAFRGLLERQALPFVAPPRSALNLDDPDSIDSSLPEEVRTVINCAGWTDVDGAETHQEEANRSNGEAVEALAAACQRRGSLLVHFSTDYVFDGSATEPYRVDHPRAPVNAYGHSKALGERALEQSGASHLLLRTSWVYAPWGKNFVLKMLELSRARPSLRVVDDQRGRPSSAEGIARTTLALIDGGSRGTFHVTDAGQCTWCELAKASIAEAGEHCQVSPCSSDEYPSPARRPAYSVLDISATVARVGALEPWQDAVRGVVRRALDAS